MAKDDYMVIVYKILAYLYGCLKAGKTPDTADYCWRSELFNIPQTYWENIMQELIDNNYIKGASVIHAVGRGAPGIKTGPDTTITIQGAEFLEEKSAIKKARTYLGEGFQTVLSGLISALA